MILSRLARLSNSTTMHSNFEQKHKCSVITICQLITTSVIRSLIVELLGKLISNRCLFEKSKKAIKGDEKTEVLHPNVGHTILYIGNNCHCWPCVCGPALPISNLNNSSTVGDGGLAKKY
jgi:hypothetical protein